MTRYVEPAAPRLTFDTVEGVDQITIPARINWFSLLFLGAWLVLWTLGGLASITSLQQHGFQLFIVGWLLMWLFGEIAVLTTVVWQLTGSETLRIVGLDLEVGYRILGFTRRRTYQGSEIRNLSVAQPGVSIEGSPPVRFPMIGVAGSVQFEYGARTIYVGAGLDPAEGRIIVDALRQRLGQGRQLGSNFDPARR